MNLPIDFEMPPIAKIITCTIEGILEQEDLLRLVHVAPTGETKQVSSGEKVEKLREKHHAVARAVAGGMTQRLAANIAGYREEYVSVLLNNPAMQELVEYYRCLHGNAQEVVTQRLRHLALGATEVLGDRLDGDPEGLSNQDLLALAKLGLDRSGHGPTSHHHVVNETHVLDHAELVKLRREAAKESAEDIIELSPKLAQIIDASKAEEGDS